MKRIYIIITRTNIQNVHCWYNTYIGECFEVKEFHSAQSELFYQLISPTPEAKVRGDIFLVHPSHCEVIGTTTVHTPSKNKDAVFITILVILALIGIWLFIQ